jgi:hypothetical protein
MGGVAMSNLGKMITDVECLNVKVIDLGGAVTSKLEIRGVEIDCLKVGKY